MLILLASCAAIAGLTFTLWLIGTRIIRRARSTGPFPSPWPEPGTPAALTSIRTVSTEPVQRGQVLFAQPMPMGLIGLDCLLAHPTAQAPVGRPVHVVGGLPANPWLAAVELQLLQEWLARGDQVTVEVFGGGSRAKVKLACQRTTLLLPLQLA